MMLLTLGQLFTAALSVIVVGYVWYHPYVFGTMWMRAVNLSPEMAERNKRHTLSFMVFAFVSGLALAFVMRVFLGALEISSTSSALLLALLAWLGFFLPTSVAHVTWEERPLSLYLIDSFYWLAIFLTVALVLSR